MKILILGGTGYLGGKMIRKLVQADCKIYCVRCQGESVTHLTEFCSRITFLSNELAEIEALMKQVKLDWVLNFAAVYQKENVRLSKIVDVNMVFALQTLNLAVENGVKNYLTIDTALPDRFNLYSFSKKRFAEFGKFYTEIYHTNFYNVVVEMFYGPDEPINRFLHQCIDKMHRNEDLLLTQGTQKRDIVHIEDVCQALLCIMNSGLEGYQRIEVGTGETPSIREIIEYMKDITGSKSKLLFGAIPMRENEPDSCTDISMLESIGFRVNYPWKSGIKEICKR